ncbi:MAG: glycosyltransferase family 2 protein [Alphaproteobacteria bacterium]|nr:glycosyltransferase family 2 protein [Alphaproteobacteria bacterium]
MKKAKLSALVVAHNEEAHLPECLARLGFADQLVVVLDRCTDGSRDIAKAAGAKLLEGAWPLEGQRRNAGIEASDGPWILEVDADERVPPALADEVLAAIEDAEPGYFLISFDNYIGRRLVRHGWGAYNGASAGPRLFTKGAKIWGDQLVHPRIVLRGPRRRLKTPIDHYVDQDISDVIARFDRYTRARAMDLCASGNIGTLPGNIRRVFSRFWKSYVTRRGYREGLYGILLALFSAAYPLVSYIRARLEGPGH